MVMLEIGARMAVAICRRLRFSLYDIEQIEALVATIFAQRRLSMRPATLKRFVRLPRFEENISSSTAWIAWRARESRCL